MGVTFLGAVFLGLTLACVGSGRRDWMPWLLSAAVPFMQSTAVTVGDNKVSPFYVASLAVVYFLLRGGAATTEPRRLSILSAFLAYAALSAVLLPVLFAGTRVLVPRGGIDGQVLSPGRLELSVSNFAQLMYVALGVAVVHYFVVNRPANIHFLGFGFALGTILNSWALVHNLTGLYYPAQIFFPGEQQSSSFNGMPRLVGTFAEPSYLATFAIAAFAYTAFRAADVRGLHRCFLSGLAGLNLLCLVFSFSGTALVSVLLLVGLVVVVTTGLLVLGRSRVSPATLVTVFAAAAAISILWETIVGYIRLLAEEKLGSDSYVARGGSNEFSWDIFIETGGFGVGLGSSRPSSFAFLLLSNIGLIGTALFIGVVVKMVRAATGVEGFRPVVWALLAVLLAKVVAEPNISSPLLWLTLAACASAGSMRASPQAGGQPASSVDGSRHLRLAGDLSPGIRTF